MTELICVHCKKPVKFNAERYEVFERMHWLCFHLNFEHDGDPDEPCGDPDCPWNQVANAKAAAYEEAAQITESPCPDKNCCGPGVAAAIRALADSIGEGEK